ncbi:hypothetical protein ACTWPP_41000 [Actinomadura sp. 3N407]
MRLDAGHLGDEFVQRLGTLGTRRGERVGHQRDADGRDHGVRVGLEMVGAQRPRR